MLVRPPADSDKTRAAARERRRRWRKRRAQGKVLLAVEVDEHAFTEALALRAERAGLDISAEPTRKQLAADAAAVIADFTKRWEPK